MDKANGYEGLLASDGLNGAVTIEVEADALLFTAPTGLFACLYGDIQSFAIERYALMIDTQFGQLRVSQMGDALEWLFESLWGAYNDAVQKALFVDGSAIYESRGAYRYHDAGGRSEGVAYVRLFHNCLLVLPPNENARRIPLCFVQEVREEAYALELVLDTGETYSFLRIGGYREGFAYQLAQCQRALQKKAMETVGDLYGGLHSMQRSAIARLMIEGRAVSIRALLEISPAFVDAVEQAVGQSRAGEPYGFFKKVCDAGEICVGFKPCEKRTAPETPPQLGAEAALPEMQRQEQEETRQLPQSNPFMIFIAAPKISGQGVVAAVELAVPEEASAATFLYRYQGEWAAFSAKLNRAMEAVSFRREVIWIKEEALDKPENAHYRMAVKRIEALRFLRGCLIGRAIHASNESWQREMEKKFNW